MRAWTVLLTLGCSTSGPIITFVDDDQLQAAVRYDNHCDKPSDCVSINRGICMFDCNLFVNTNKVDYINNIIDQWELTQTGGLCLIECRRDFTIQCTNNI